jgi:hypothetical protein
LARFAFISAVDFADIKETSNRLGRTVLLTNRMDWAAEQVVNGYSGQQQVE